MTESAEPEIRALDAGTVERIAAGEVVERPASAVKELVENSLDADPSRVTVAVEAGGTERIRVTDDGIGMSESGVRRAVQKHTTSKISDVSDLAEGVSTLGFRGEALHAIGAVSRMSITTRPREGGTGTELAVEGGEIMDVSPAGSPAGTTVEVRDLFYNVPARKKYLKQESTEFAHVNTVVTSYALANPDVAVTLEHDGRETFATTGQGELRETVLSVYGRDVAEAMFDIGKSVPEGPLGDISGLVSHPETNRASSEYVTTFVNGRYVTAGAIREAVVDAYDTQLAPDRYPFAVIFLDVDPATVDVNVHPRKLEVRFADEEPVREQIKSTVEQRLLDAGLVRSSAPRGQSAPEQTEIQPEGNTGTAETVDGAATDDGTESTQAVGESVDQSERAQSDTTGRRAEPTPDRGERAQSGGGENQTGRSPQDREPPSSEKSKRTESTASVSHSGGDETATRSDSEEKNSARRGRKFEGGSSQTYLGEGTPDLSLDRLPAMRVLGQVHDTYVVAETEAGVVLLDQHAADERVNYERLRDTFEGETTTQALADPIRLELTAREAALFESNDDALARLGFQARRVDERLVEVTTVPALVARTAGPELLRDVLLELPDGETAAAETVDETVDSLLADLACHPSVTGNTSLTEGSVVELLSALDDCENPYACPHGRPVLVELDNDELEARFERDYPGHQ